MNLNDLEAALHVKDNKNTLNDLTITIYLKGDKNVLRKMLMPKEYITNDSIMYYKDDELKSVLLKDVDFYFFMQREKEIK